MTLPAPARTTIEPHFLPGPRGHLFALLRRPAEDISPRRAVLCAMPFAEEMNRSRHLVARQAEALASRGVAVLCIDLFGCGDSQGEFEDAAWSDWLEDLRFARHWLGRKTGHQPDVWAIRHGALLAAQAFDAASDHASVLWQPVVRGAGALSELLRVHVAGAMLADRSARRNTSALKTELLNGNTVNVGGYPITAVMARALEGADLSEWTPAGPVHWLEVTPDPAVGLAPANAAIVDRWRDDGTAVSHLAVPGRRFWSTPEPGPNPSLIEATLDALGAGA